MDHDKETTYTLRLPESLKKQFEITAKSLDQTGAQVVRSMMREFVHKYQQPDMFEKPAGRKAKR